MELAVGLGMLSSGMRSHSGMGKVPPPDTLR